MQPADDSTLLRQYASNHSDEALAELVTWRINLVYSVEEAYVQSLFNPNPGECL